MALYYFNLQDGTSCPDNRGRELDTVRQARITAIDYVAEMLRSPNEDLWKGQESVLRVTDAHGDLLFTLAFCASDAALAVD